MGKQTAGIGFVRSIVLLATTVAAISMLFVALRATVHVGAASGSRRRRSPQDARHGPVAPAPASSSNARRRRASQGKGRATATGAPTRASHSRVRRTSQGIDKVSAAQTPISTSDGRGRRTSPDVVPILPTPASMGDQSSELTHSRRTPSSFMREPAPSRWNPGSQPR